MSARRRGWFARSILGLVSLLVAGGAARAEWPERPVEFVIGFAAGGGADQTLLPLKPLLEQRLGQSVLFVYKPGADGQLGWEYLHQRGREGYTIAGLSLPHLPASVVLREPSYGLADLASVGIIASDVPVLFVRKDSPLQNLNDLLAAARERPSEVTLAIGSFSGEHYITTLALEQQTGVKFRYVNTRGGGKVLSNILGGHMEVGVARPSVISGVLSEVRGIAIASAERHRLIPDTPTFEEQLPPEAEIPLLRAARGVVVSRSFKDNDPAGFARLTAAVAEAVRSPEYAAVLERLGLDLVYMPPDEADAYAQDYRGQIEKYRELLESEG